MGIPAPRPIRATGFRPTSFSRVQPRVRRLHARQLPVFELEKPEVVIGWRRPRRVIAERHLPPEAFDQVDQRSVAQPEFGNSVERRIFRRIRKHDAEHHFAAAARRPLFRVQLPDDVFTAHVAAPAAGGPHSLRAPSPATTATAAAAADSRQRLRPRQRSERPDVVTVAPADRTPASSYLTQRRSQKTQPSHDGQHAQASNPQRGRIED